MPTAGHPGALSPRLPELTVDLPDGWVVEPGDDALVRAHDGRGDAHAPALAAYVHTTRDADVAALCDDLASRALARDEGEADPTFEVELGDRTWTGLNVSWVEGGEAVFVVHLLTVLPAGEVAQVVRWSGRVSGPDAETDYDTLQGVLETVRVVPARTGVDA